jgi:hypothetical protein
MPGGPVATGSGLGGDKPTSKFFGLIMVAFAAFGGVLYGAYIISRVAVDPKKLIQIKVTTLV